MSLTTILKKTVCIQLVVPLWTGQRRVRPEDLGFNAADFPPERLASPGALKLCDPKALSDLRNAKRAAERDCRQLCYRFLGGYATDEKNLKKLLPKLEKRQREFEAAAAEFLNALPEKMWDPLESTCRHASLSIL